MLDTGTLQLCDPVISRVHFLFKPVILAAPEDFEATILLQFYSKPSPDSSTLVKAALAEA